MAFILLTASLEYLHKHADGLFWYLVSHLIYLFLSTYPSRKMWALLFKHLHSFQSLEDLIVSSQWKVFSFRIGVHLKLGIHWLKILIPHSPFPPLFWPWLCFPKTPFSHIMNSFLLESKSRVALTTCSVFVGEIDVHSSASHACPISRGIGLSLGHVEYLLDPLFLPDFYFRQNIGWWLSCFSSCGIMCFNFVSLAWPLGMYGIGLQPPPKSKAESDRDFYFSLYLELFPLNLGIINIIDSLGVTNGNDLRAHFSQFLIYRWKNWGSGMSCGSPTILQA